MKVGKTPVEGALLIELSAFADARGVFAEAFNKDKLRPHGIVFDVRMTNFSLTEKAGTVRGMHWQARPFAQGKIVFSARGRIFDAIVDVRPGSPTRGTVFSLELFPQANALYIPAGVAHGCQALEDQVMLVYLLDNVYKPSHERGMRPDDPDIRIPWPLPMSHVAPRDLSWPTFRNLTAESEGGPRTCGSSEADAHCHCDRDADGRCARCTAILGETVAIMTRTMKSSQERIASEVDDLGDMCPVCKRETYDYMLAKIVRDVGRVQDNDFMTPEMLPFFIQAIRGAQGLSETQGITRWPLLDKAIEDVMKEAREKGLESPDGP